MLVTGGVQADSPVLVTAALDFSLACLALFRNARLTITFSGFVVVDRLRRFPRRTAEAEAHAADADASGAWGKSKFFLEALDALRFAAAGGSGVDDGRFFRAADALVDATGVVAAFSTGPLAAASFAPEDTDSLPDLDSSDLFIIYFEILWYSFSSY